MEFAFSPPDKYGGKSSHDDEEGLSVVIKVNTYNFGQIRVSNNLATVKISSYVACVGWYHA